jgi:hypothetical protein
MPANITTKQVWRELEKRSLAILGFALHAGKGAPPFRRDPTT